MITHSHRTGLKTSAIALCIVGAFSAAFLTRPAPKLVKSAEASSISPALQPTEVLDAIPIQSDGSASGKAVAAAMEKARKSPQAPAGWVVLGDTLRQRLRESGDQTYYDFAEKAYRQALRLQAANVDAINGMAWLTGGRHVFDESMKWANEALALSPNSADAHGIIGDAELELGNYDAAYDHYQTMMDLRPDLSSWSRGAYLLWLTGDKLKGTGLMEKAIRAGAPFAENLAWCRAKLAVMLMQDGAFAAAAQVLAPSLREHSRHPHILLAAARLATSTRDYDIAAQYYQKLLEAGPNHDAFVGLGDLHAIQGERAEAEDDYRKVETLHAAHLATGVHDHMQMARFLADHDRNLVEALRLAEQHKLTRNVLEADTLAWVYYKNGDMLRAAEAIKRALSRNTPEGEIHYHAGMIAAALGDAASAREHLRKALAMSPAFNPLQTPVAEQKLASLSNQTNSSAGLAGSPEVKGAAE